MRELWKFLALASLAAPAFAAEDSLAIGAARFTQAEILDARAQPQVDGQMAILLSFDDAAAKRLAEATRAQSGKGILVQWNGKTLCTPVIPSSITDGAFLLDCFPKQSFDEAAALAKTISGKEPLPETLEDEP